MQHTIGTGETEIDLVNHYRFSVSIVGLEPDEEDPGKNLNPEDLEVPVNGNAIVTKDTPYTEGGSCYMESITVKSNYQDTLIEVE